MAKKTPKKINKQSFDLNKFKDKNNLNTIVKDKPLEFIPLSDAIQESIGIPGIPKGYFSLFRGYSNTGKSTVMHEGIASCQKMGILPIIIDTENSFNWEHAKNIGVEFNELVDGDGVINNYDGDFLYFNTTSLKQMYSNYNYQDGKETKELRDKAVLEDVAHLINDLLLQQKNGELPIELCFFWDSIGSLNCFKSVKSNAANNMWNAGALSTAFNDIVNDSIPSSKKEGEVYTNTFVGIQKIWLDSQSGGAGVVKHKGGEALFYAARLVVHLGGVLSHGTSRLQATADGNKYYYGTKTKIKIVKNHINGIEYDGEVASTPHGFINPDKKNDYTKDKRDWILEKLKVGKDAKIEYSEVVTDTESAKELMSGK